jgi:hypothetical protein
MRIDLHGILAQAWVAALSADMPPAPAVVFGRQGAAAHGIIG